MSTEITDIFEGRWRQLRGELRSWWGRLTDDDLEHIAGQKDKLLGRLQEKYGYTREEARREVDRRLQEYAGRLGQTMPGATYDEASKGKVKEAAAGAATKVAQATSVVGEKIGSLAGVIREKAPQQETVRIAATAVANRLDAARTYLQETDLGQVGGDLGRLIRRYPLPALLIGLGIGYLWGRSRREHEE
jgi:uncharacterized protein YjbJ (UPF0337 family)